MKEVVAMFEKILFIMAAVATVAELVFSVWKECKTREEGKEERKGR